MLGALLLCLSLAIDLALPYQPHTETVLNTVDAERIIHYTTGGRFTLEKALPINSRLWVERTPLWRTAVSARLPPHGELVEIESLYYGASNCFWLGLLLTAALAIWPQRSPETRLMATLSAVVLLILTLSALFSA